MVLSEVEELLGSVDLSFLWTDALLAHAAPMNFSVLRVQCQEAEVSPSVKAEKTSN